MASVYTNDLRLEEIGSGEQSGSWGDTTNTNLELIAEAFSFGTEAITTNADTHATTIADGATDAGRSMFLKYTGTLDSACTITIGPNTVSKLWFIENGTSGSQNIIIKQGSGATITIAAGQTKAIYSNGAGSGGAMVDAFASLSVVDLIVSDDLIVGDDLGVTGLVTIGETLAVTGVLTTTAQAVFNGGFASNGDSLMGTNKKLLFRDSAIHISSTSDGLLNIDADTEVDITSTLIDINGNVEISGTTTQTGVITANAGVVIDEMTLDADTLTATDDFIIDCAGSITLDADGGDVQFKDNGVSIGAVINNNSDFVFRSLVSDKDVLIKGNDGGSTITALTLDMSLAGEAVFNAGAVVNESGIDSNFRVESASNSSMLFVDAGTHRVSIGHGVPLAKLDVMGQGTASDNLSMLIGADENSTINPVRTNGANKSCRIGIPHFTNTEQPQAFLVGFNTSSASTLAIGGGTGVMNAATAIQFKTAADNVTTNGSVRMAIDNNGLVGVGTTSGTGQLSVIALGDRCAMTVRVNANGDGGICFLNASGTGVGNILVNSSSVTYGESSDYRLKENVDYTWDATTRLKQLKPARFNFIIDDTNTLVDGFLAHEVSSIVPQAVIGTHNETQTLTKVVLSSSNAVLSENIEQSDWTDGKSSTTDIDKNTIEAIYPSNSTWVAEHVVPKMQNIDQAKLVPLLVKTILELEARITALES